MGAYLCWLAVRVLEMHRILKPTGSMYLHIDHTAHAYAKCMLDAIFGRQNFRNEVVWDYSFRMMNLPRFFNRKHDILLFYAKSKDAKFRMPKTGWTREEVIRTRKQKVHIDENGEEWIWMPGGKGKSKRRLKRIADIIEEGKAVSDVWSIPVLSSSAKERTGYPTQKPLALYERIIKASSNEGDIVLDPFAGCATTCVAAERLERQWIGIDINEPAEQVVKERLQKEVNANMNWNELVCVWTEPPKRTDGGAPVAPELVLVRRGRTKPQIPVSELRETLLTRDGQRCQGCGWEPPYPDYLEVDHKKPRSLGGDDYLDNRTLLCSPCNRLKSNKLTLTELRHERVAEGRIEADWWEDERWQ